jgi:hypothetical protein
MRASAGAAPASPRSLALPELAVQQAVVAASVLGADAAAAAPISTFSQRLWPVAWAVARESSAAAAGSL